jgi:hypothetical protein
MKTLRITLLSLVVFCGLHAEEVSMKRAVAMSLLVPGSGEFYAKSYTRAGVFFGAEMAAWFAFYQFHRDIDWTTDSYQRYASAKAGIPENSPEWVYEKAQDYYSSSEYNLLIEQEARNYYLIYKNEPDSYKDYYTENSVSEDHSWVWKDHDSWQHYNDLRIHKQDMQIYTKLAIGAALLNRMISAVDTARLVRGINRNSRYYGNLSVSPDWQKTGMRVNYEYRF